MNFKKSIAALAGVMMLAPVGAANAAETGQPLINDVTKVPQAQWHGKALPIAGVEVNGVISRFSADYDGEIPASDRTDSDNDGASDEFESKLSGTDPNNPDTDGDGLSDGVELRIGTNARLTDPDEDGLSDYEEVMIYGTNPRNIDTDGDSLNDKVEIDGSANKIKSSKFDPNRAPGNTNPLAFDTDSDGINDYIEVELQKSQFDVDPNNPDTDGDGLLDGEEYSMTRIDGLEDYDESTAWPFTPRPKYVDASKAIYQMFGWDENIGGIDDNKNGIPDAEEEPAASIGRMHHPTMADTDSDGVLDGKDFCPFTPAGTKVGADGCMVKVAAPTIEVSDKTITAGDEFDPVKDMVTDSAGGEVKVEAPEGFDAAKPGEYEFTFTITNEGGTATKTAKLTVKAKVAAPTLEVSDKTITAGDEFDPVKDMVTDSAGGEVKVEAPEGFDAAKPGEYEFTFTITNESGTATKTAKLTVKAKVAAPTLEVSDKTITAGDAFDPVKDMVTDSAGGEVKVTAPEGFDANKPGEYEFTFTINNEGGTATKTAKLTVKYKAPTLEVSSVKITEGDTFDPASVVKNVSGGDPVFDQEDLAKIDTSKPGTYVLKVSVSTPDGQTVTRTAMVEVVAKQAPAPDPQAPSLEVKNVEITAGDEFDPNTTVVKTDGEVSFDLGKLDTKTPGSYEIQVSATGEGGTTTKTAKVTVKYAAPELKTQDVTVNAGDKFDPNTLVVKSSSKPTFDQADLDKVDTSKPGIYEVKVTVSTPDGQSITQTAKVNVVEADNIGQGIEQTKTAKPEAGKSEAKQAPAKKAKAKADKPGLPTTGAAGGVGLLAMISAAGAGLLARARRNK